MPEPERLPVPEQDAAAGQRVSDLLARLSGEDLSRRERATLLRRLAAALAVSMRAAGGAAVAGGSWLADTLLDVAPRIAVRDAATLSRHHDGRTGEALADLLVRTAVRASAGVGAGAGALAAVEWAAPPVLLSAPVQVAAETLAVAAIEVKLVAELHEVYGAGVPGTGTQRAQAYVQAWAARRGVDPSRPGSLRGVAGAAAKHRIRRRIVGRLGRNLTTFGPFLTGAVAGGWINQAETRKLAEAVRHDLRGRLR